MIFKPLSSCFLGLSRDFQVLGVVSAAISQARDGCMGERRKEQNSPRTFLVQMTPCKQISFSVSRETPMCLLMCQTRFRLLLPMADLVTGG